MVINFKKSLIGTLAISLGLVLAGCSNNHKTEDANTRTNDTSAYVNHHLQQTQYFSSVTYDKIHNRIIFHLKPQYNPSYVKGKAQLRVHLAIKQDITHIRRYAHNPSVRTNVVDD